MPRITVDATATEVMTSFPADTIAISHISAIETTLSKVKNDPETGAELGGHPMAVLEWELDEGPYKGRKVGFHYVMLGGTTKHGTPMPLTQLFQLIDAVKAPWAANPSAPLVARPFKWITSDRGTLIAFDPDTNQKVDNPDINFPEDFINKKARVKYGVRKALGSDRSFNEVSKVMPLT